MKSSPALGILHDVLRERRDVHGWYRQTKATKCSGTDGRDSEHLIVPQKRGNPAPGRPRGGKEMSYRWTR